MMALRIAMWSGPRNISTAMMRAFENRPDTIVWDEPLYAYFLRETGIDHPMRAETLAAHDADSDRVIGRCAHDPLPNGTTIFYQKQMTHHFLDGLPWEWLDELANCFLIRDPREMLLSYARKRETATAEDLGLARQVEIFERVRKRTGSTPPVLDAEDVLRDPRGTLGALCETFGIPFTDAMLKWPAGLRESDGAWADHWYDAVRQSTGFAPWRPREGELSERMVAVLETSRPFYETMRAHRLRA